MRTSDTRRRSKAAGFTLLELVVVLALLGLATALVAPAGFRMIETWRRATEIDTALGALSGLGEQARREGRSLRFRTGRVEGEAIPGIPAGWNVDLAAPLDVQANGACSASRGMLRQGAHTRAFAIEAPYCRASLLAEPAP